MAFAFFAFILILCIGAYLRPAFLSAQSVYIGDEGEKSFYQNQLLELDAQVLAGEIDADLRDETRREIVRRFSISQENRPAALRASAVPAGLNLRIFVSVMFFLVSGATALYWSLGAPGMGDAPRSERLAAAQARLKNRIGQDAIEARLGQRENLPEGEVGELLLALRLKARERDDRAGYRLLSGLEAQIGNYVRAHQSWKMYLARRQSPNAGDYAQYSAFLIFAAEGYISPEAEKAARAALALEPDNFAARRIMGQLYFQIGRPDRAFVIWKKLLTEKALPPEQIINLQAQLSEAALRAGFRYSPDSPEARAK